MSIAVAPVRADTDARSGDFYALVKSVHGGMFSNKVSGLFVEVLSGSVESGDQIEVLRPDGTTVLVVARRLRQGGPDIVLELEEPQPPKDGLAGATVARSAGLPAPRLPAEASPGFDRLLAAVRTARAEGFPLDWATPIKQVGGLPPESLCVLFRSLPDEAVALVVQKRARDAMGHHDNPFAIMPDVERAAMHLSAVGLAEDGDRLLLIAAAAVQGRRSSVAVRAAGTIGATGVLASEKVVEAGLDLGRRVGWAIGIEMGDTFAKAFESNVAAAGEVIEGALLDARRAVGVGWCRRCDDAVQATFARGGLTASPQHRCPNDGHKIDDVMLVVPADAAEVQRALRSDRRPVAA